MENTTYSIHVNGSRLGWSFRSLWAAQYQAGIACGAARADSYVVDDLTGEVMYIFSPVAGSHVFRSYAAEGADEIAYPGARFVNVPAEVA